MNEKRKRARGGRKASSSQCCCVYSARLGGPGEPAVAAIAGGQVLASQRRYLPHAHPPSLPAPPLRRCVAFQLFHRTAQCCTCNYCNCTLHRQREADLEADGTSCALLHSRCLAVTTDVPTGISGPSFRHSRFSSGRNMDAGPAEAWHAGTESASRRRTVGLGLLLFFFTLHSASCLSHLVRG